MPKLTVNDKEIEVENGITVLQACEEAGVEIPRFCYHNRLSIAGNCRMCLVEVEKAPKPVASCAMPATEGMIIRTNTPMVKKAREGVMEFLLINHPLDCPICDQGGECDLQDQAMLYGAGSSRFSENKRTVPDKDMGPLIKTHMTRCIHCTRCIRFSTEVAGVDELGAIGRGENMQITSYLEKAVLSELSGNVIDLCPVGALTSKPYAFKARSWELKRTSSIDVMDAVGSNIRVDSRGVEVMRVLPRINDEINEEWISDKTRFSYDGLKLQRLDVPMIKRNNKLVEATWNEAFAEIAEHLKNRDPDSLAALAGDLACVESMKVLKDIINRLGSRHLDCRGSLESLSNRARGNYLFNTSIEGIESADLCLLIGADPRYDAAILNSRVRKSYLHNGLKVFSIGKVDDLTYPIKILGDDIGIISDIVSGNNEFARLLEGAKNPMLIVGTSALSRNDGKLILSNAYELARKYNIIREDWNGFNVLHSRASLVGGIDIGFLPGDGAMGHKEIMNACADGKVKTLFLLGCDEINPEKLRNSFVIYQGHHGDIGAQNADVILPGAAYTEKSATYVNLEGRAQRTQKSVSPPGGAKSDWVILVELARYLGIELSYSSLREIREEMANIAPCLGQLDKVTKSNIDIEPISGSIHNKGPLESRRINYYMTNIISKFSPTMAKCNEMNKMQEEAA